LTAITSDPGTDPLKAAQLSLLRRNLWPRVDMDHVEGTLPLIVPHSQSVVDLRLLPGDALFALGVPPAYSPLLFCFFEHREGDVHSSLQHNPKSDQAQGDDQMAHEVGVVLGSVRILAFGDQV